MASDVACEYAVSLACAVAHSSVSSVDVGPGLWIPKPAELALRNILLERRDDAAMRCRVPQATCACSKLPCLISNDAFHQPIVNRGQKDKQHEQ